MTCVLLHGLGQGPSSWDGVREALPSHLPVVCPSLGERLAGREAVYADLFPRMGGVCQPPGWAAGAFAASPWAGCWPWTTPSATRSGWQPWL